MTGNRNRWTRPGAALVLTVLVLAGVTGCNDHESQIVVVPPPEDPPAVDPPAAPALLPEPIFSPGTANTVAWSEGQDADSYEVEAATSADFDAGVLSSGWIEVTSFTFTGLAGDRVYHFRVRARNTGGESAWSASVSTTQDAGLPQAVLASLDPQQPSRRFDLQLAAVDTGSGIAAIEIWARPAGGEFALVTVSVADSLRFTAPEEGPHGAWEFAAVAIDSVGNRETTGPPPAAEVFTEVPEPIYLTDRQGERWEITAAVLKYGLGVSQWEHGLGRDAILPLVDPRFVSAGEPGYLDPDNLAVVLGVERGGEARAYKIADLVDREVVDDTYGEAHLAVTY